MNKNHPINVLVTNPTGTAIKALGRRVKPLRENNTGKEIFGFNDKEQAETFIQCIKSTAGMTAEIAQTETLDEYPKSTGDSQEQQDSGTKLEGRPTGSDDTKTPIEYTREALFALNKKDQGEILKSMNIKGYSNWSEEERVDAILAHQSQQESDGDNGNQQ